MFRHLCLILATALASTLDPHVGGPPVPRALVQAHGADSFNQSAMPFWSVTHLGEGPAIVRIVFDWSTSSIVEQRAARFDVDQRGLSGFMYFGNAQPPGLGTYRNGSDVQTGLIYDAANTFIGEPRDGTTGGNCGFIASLPCNDLNDFQKLEFRFTAGLFAAKTFAFDCDTDGGLGYAGGHMRGLTVAVTFADGSVVQGELESDPANPNRAYRQF